MTQTCPMTLARAIAHVNAVAGRVLSAYSRAGMAGAVKHVLAEAVLGGARFETERDVEAWLTANTGIQALEVASS